MMGHHLIFCAFSERTTIRVFSEQWVGRRGAVSWPARSSDLNPLDCWLLGHPKTLVYSAPNSDLLQHQVENACQEIRVEPGIFDRVSASVRRRADVCGEMQGNNKEHLLQVSLEHRPCQQTWFLDVC
jgi:hypothetical protein